MISEHSGHSGSWFSSFALLKAFALCICLMLAPAIAHGGDHDWSGLRIGASVHVAPKYEGSDEYRLIGFPIILPKLGDDGLGGIFRRYVRFQGLDDVRLKLIRVKSFEAGPLIGYTFGRDEDDGDRLVGLGDVDGGLIAGAFARYSWSIFYLDASYHHQVSGGADGFQLRLSGGFSSPMSPGLRLHGRVGATFADDSYMDSYFSVSAQQAAQSAVGLPVYNAGASVKDFFAELGVYMMLHENWILKPSIRYTQLLNDAADSPIVETEHQLSGRLGLTYKWRP